MANEVDQWARIGAELGRVDPSEPVPGTQGDRAATIRELAIEGVLGSQLNSIAAQGGLETASEPKVAKNIRKVRQILAAERAKQ